MGGFESGRPSEPVSVIKPRKVPGSSVVFPIYCNIKSELSVLEASIQWMTKSVASNPLSSIEAGFNLPKSKIVMPQQSCMAALAELELDELGWSGLPVRSTAEAVKVGSSGEVQIHVQTQVGGGGASSYVQ
jgi:hypothetical protein